MDTKQRAQQKFTNLQQEWDLLNEKLSRLEQAKILETRADEIFRLEHTIEEIKRQIQKVEQELKNLEHGSTTIEDEVMNHENYTKGKPPTLAELRKHLADFLQTAIDLSDSTSQKTFIDQVGFEVRLRQQIHFGGVQSQFISLLISILMNYGTLDDGRDALEAVLETAKEYVSKNHITRCDELIQELRLFRWAAKE